MLGKCTQLNHLQCGNVIFCFLFFPSPSFQATAAGARDGASAHSANIRDASGSLEKNPESCGKASMPGP